MKAEVLLKQMEAVLKEQLHDLGTKPSCKALGSQGLSCLAHGRIPHL